MTTTGKAVFHIGVGYIGRELLDRLLEEKYDVTALVRREEAAKELEREGVKALRGSLDEAQKIEQQTEKSDIVFHTATSDDLPSVKAVISGIEKRAAAGKHTIYIHTSGTGVLADQSGGQYKSDEVFSDLRPDQIDALPDSAAHRWVDLEIVRARQRLGTRASLAIALPALIYGSNPKHQRLSIQAITMTRFAIKHKYAGHIGKGKAVWSLVHVTDLSRAYMTLLHYLEKASDSVALEAPYFFCENGEEISWGEIAEMIGKQLKAAGRLEDPTPKEIPSEQYDDLFGIHSPVVLGSNSRSRAERLRQLGWSSKQASFIDAFKKEELPIILKEDLSDIKGYGKDGYGKLPASSSG